MKKLLAALSLALLVGLLALAMSGVAGATHNNKTDVPPQDFTTGAGKFSTGGVEQKFAFSAHDADALSATPEARNGHYVVEARAPLPGAPLVEVKGEVDCLRVLGNRAFFGGPIEKSSNPALEGQFAFFDVVDNDQAPANGAAPDQFRFELLRGTPVCFGPISGLPITQGNITVHDGQPNSPGPNAAEAEAPTEEEALKQREALGIDTEALKKELIENGASSKEEDTTPTSEEETTSEEQEE